MTPKLYYDLLLDGCSIRRYWRRDVNGIRYWIKGRAFDQLDCSRWQIVRLLSIKRGRK